MTVAVDVKYFTGLMFISFEVVFCPDFLTKNDICIDGRLYADTSNLSVKS